jgi:phosphate acetyltransferase
MIMPHKHIKKATSKNHFVDLIIDHAKKNPQKILFPESEDPRILEAVTYLARNKIVKPVLLGKPKKEILGVDVIDPAVGMLYVDKLVTIRKKKGMTKAKAKKLLTNKMYVATMLLKEGLVDGIVNGATCPTAETFRPPLQIIKTKKGVTTASSYFVMLHEGKTFFFADCAFNINPDAKQLADIAINTAEGVASFGITPRVALLSFSTKGSGQDQSLDKIKEALKIIKRRQPKLIVDGEMQFDAAIIPRIAKSKAPRSPIKGNANTLIFPDLNSGNIAYKIAQRFAHDEPIGPITQGLKKPVNDLSRGCTVEEIIGVAALTAIQAQELRK